MGGRWGQRVRALSHGPALGVEWLRDLRGDLLRPLSLASSPCLEGLPMSKGEGEGGSRVGSGHSGIQSAAHFY